MIPLSEEDYIIIEKGNFTCKFKPPIEQIETEIMQLGNIEFDEKNVEDREAFEKDRQKVRDFLSLCLIEVQQKRGEKIRVFNKEGVIRIPFAMLLAFFYAYINDYNLSMGELKN